MSDDKRKAISRRYYLGHKEEIRDRLRKWRTENPKKARASRLRGLHKLRDRRRELLNSWKDRPCADCQRRYPPECMDFDHVRGTKEGVIGYMYMGAVEKLRKEVAKCDVVCANCHRIRTSKRRKEK